MSTKKMSSVIYGNMSAYEGKIKFSIPKVLVLGIMAGAFVAIGASTAVRQYMELRIQVSQRSWRGAYSLSDLYL